MIRDSRTTVQEGDEVSLSAREYLHQLLEDLRTSLEMGLMGIRHTLNRAGIPIFPPGRARARNRATPDRLRRKTVHPHLRPLALQIRITSRVGAQTPAAEVGLQ